VLEALDWVAPDDSLAHLEQAKWLRRHIDPARIVLRMDSLVGMAEAVARRHGAGMLVCLLAARHPELVPLAEPDDALDTQIWVLSHPDLRQVARMQALMQFLVETLRADPRLAH
jgi:DNA-binding transcriptional LysR family regulator